MGQTPYLLVAVLFIVSLLIWWRAIWATFSLALQSDQYTHIFLVLPVSVALVLLHWRSREGTINVSPTSGFPLLALALFILWVASHKVSSAADVQLAALMLALVTWWIGSFTLSFGIRALQTFVFPLLFLFWLVPLPTVVLDRIVSFLQKGSAAATYDLFWIFRVPVLRDGVVLSIPGVSIEVAAECSSIRSSLMLLLSTMVLGHLFLRSVWRKIILALIAVPLSVAKNAVRIFTLSMLGTRVDPSYLTGRLHHEGGIIFFLLVLAVVVLLVRLLRDSENPKTLPG